MPAYVVADLTLTDPEGFEEYRDAVTATVARYGGRYLMRGGEVEALEGQWNPSRLTVIEFPSAEQAKAWWNSEEYRHIKAVRQRTTRTNLLVVEGV
jgi:uncharacterized protein (DUF1330 family)